MSNPRLAQNRNQRSFTDRMQSFFGPIGRFLLKDKLSTFLSKL